MRSVVATAIVGAIALTACIHSTSPPLSIGNAPPMEGVKGGVTYAGGPARPGSPVLRPGKVAAYSPDGHRVSISYFHEGQRYLLRLLPGTYRLVATSGDAVCPERNVTVVADRFETVPILCSVK